MRYGQIRDGESFRIKLNQALMLQCCSCGLVHEINFKVSGDELYIKMREHRGETRKAREQDRVKRATRKLKA